MKSLTPLMLIPISIFLFHSDYAMARDLVEAASSAQSMFNRIGVAGISIGITLGGILYAVGMAQIGRMILLSGFIGACAVLGAPAIISLIGRVFGVAV